MDGHGDLRQLCRTVITNGKMPILVKQAVLALLTGCMLHFEIGIGIGEVRTKCIIPATRSVLRVSCQLPSYFCSYKNPFFALLVVSGQNVHSPDRNGIEGKELSFLFLLVFNLSAKGLLQIMTNGIKTLCFFLSGLVLVVKLVFLFDKLLHFRLQRLVAR